MTDIARHYFVYGNTAQGFINMLSSNLQGIERLFIIRGRPGTGKACFMSNIADICKKTGLSLEYLHCPTAPDTYDGVIIPDLKLAVVDGTDLHYTKIITSTPDARYIDTDSVFDGNRMDELTDSVSKLYEDIVNCHERAFEFFHDALGVHDEWEKIYIENMDFSKSEALADALIAMMLGNSRMEKTPVSKERFFGAGTPLGAMDYIEKLTGNISKRYLLKGRPGTGKSTLLRKLADAALARRLDTEIYHCAFDSGSLDMLIWPELDLCIFDSTAPHLYEPSRPNDEVIDMYAKCVRPGTDERYAKELEDITARYKKAVQSGTNCLFEAKIHLDELTERYHAAANLSEIDRLCAEFVHELNL